MSLSLILILVKKSLSKRKAQKLAKAATKNAKF